MRMGSRVAARHTNATKMIVSVVLAFVMMFNGIPAHAVAEAIGDAPGESEQNALIDAGQPQADQPAENSGGEAPPAAAQPDEQPAIEEVSSTSAEKTNQSESAAQDTKQSDTAAESQDAIEDESASQPDPQSEATPAQDAKPAQTFAGAATNGIKVRASVDEGVFPAGTTMEVRAVDTQTARLIGMQVVDEGQSVVSVQAVDISFYDLAHTELEPQDGQGVHVAIQLPESVQTDDLVVAHQANNGTVQEVQDVQTNEATSTAEFVGTEFSVYAVIETTPVVTFEFYESETAADPVRTQRVVEGDYLYAPGPPAVLPEGTQLVGWVIAGQENPIDFATSGDGTYTLTRGDIEQAVEGVVRVNARYGEVYYATFYDQSGNVFSRIAVAADQTIAADDLPAKFACTGVDESLAGWSTTRKDVGSTSYEGSATDMVEFPLSLSADTPYYPVIASAHVIHFDANRMLGMKENATYGYKTMTVSYTPPQVVAYGANTVQPKTNPTAEGGAFTFVEWCRDPECTQPFVWGNPLDNDITLYAKWQPATTTYRVNVWKEKVDVKLTDTAHTSTIPDPSKFDFWSSTAYEAPVLVEDNGVYVPNKVSIADDAPQHTADHGFVYRASDTEKIVQPDGTTELNVYWNREERSVTFHEGTEIGFKGTNSSYFKSFDFHTTYTGLYDQSFELYGWTWPTDSLQTTGVVAGTTGSWRAQFQTYGEVNPNTQYTDRMSYVRGSRGVENVPSVHLKTGFNDALATDYYYLVETEPDISLYYVLQDTDGDWPVNLDDPTIIALQSNAKTKFHVTDLFPNFEPTGYSIDSIVGEADRLAIPRSSDESEDMRIPPQATATTKRFVYFSRDTHKVRFYTDASKSTQAFPEETKYWNQDISGYGDDQYKLDDPSDGTKTFAGWYYAPGVTDPSLAIDWTNLVMPANDIELYPIWVANSVHVLIDPAADDVQLNAGQSKAFWTDLGDTIDMTYLDAATRADHTLDGWYLPNNGYAAAWTASDVIGAGICDCDENGDPIKTEDPLYKNSYYTLTLQARWSYSRSAKVRYDLNGGTNTTGNENAFADSADQYLFGGNVQVTTATPTPPEGKVFLAWQDKVAGSVDAHSASHVPGSTFAYDDEDMVTTEDGQDYIVLKAVYVTHNAPTSTITYYPNYTGATSNPKVSESYEWGDQITLPNNTFTRDGYELAGWSDKPEVSTAGAQLFLAGSTVGVNAFGTTIDDVTNRGNNNLYAVWRKVLSVEGASATMEYNGAEQTVTGLKPNVAGYSNPRFQGDGGDWVEVVSDTARVSGTNVGTYTGTVGSTKVLGTQGADNGQDISERFKVEATPGTLTITPRDLSSDEHKDEVSVTLADAGAYDGKQKKPAATVTVTIDGAAHTLVEGTDYTVAYSNNVNAVESTDQNAPTATITFKGNYVGTASTTFSIAKATVTVTPKPAQSKVYGENDPALEYEATGLVGSDALSGKLTRETGENAGDYAYDASGLSAGDNYEVVLASDADKFTITRKPLTFTWPTTTTFEYDETEKSLEATIAAGLVKDGDVVTLVHEDNTKTNVGSYTAKVTGLAGKDKDNYYFASDEPTASRVWSITTAKQAKPTATHTGTTGKTARDGTVTVDPAAGTTAEYSTDGGATWSDVPADGTIAGLSAGDVLVRTKGDDNHDPSDPITQTVGYKLTGTLHWNYTYSTPTSGGSVTVDSTQWSKSAKVTLNVGGQTPRVTTAEATTLGSSTAEGTYTFEDVPLNTAMSVVIEPTVEHEGQQVASPNYTVTMRANNLDADINYSQDCFDATWRVDITSVGTVDGVAPDTVYVKVLFAESASDANNLSKYQVIVQQRDSDDVQRNGAACALSAGTGGVAYTATGSYPVWKTQSDGTSTYYHKAQVVGYTVNGTYFDCTDKGYVSEGAMTCVNGVQDPNHNPMVVTIENLDVPVLEFNPNGEGATVATPYVLGSGYGSEVPAATITGNTATWTGFTFEGWYMAAAPTAGTKQETALDLDGKTTLYAHWKQSQDAPTGLTATKASSTADATISNVTGAMEYSTDDGDTWTSVTGTTIGGLSRDAQVQVQVRYKEAPANETTWPKHASPATTITIQAKDSQNPPALAVTKASTVTATDASVTVEDYDPATKPAVYSTDDGNTWTNVPSDGVIDNLGAGTTVQVKYAETDDYEASGTAEVTIEAKAQTTVKPTIQAPSATTIQVTNPQPGATYTLCDASGNPIDGADPIPATANDDVIFEGCTPGTTYTVLPSIADDAGTHYTCVRSDSATTPKLDIVAGTAVPAALDRTYNGLAQTLVTALTGDQLPEGCTKVLYSIQYPEDTSWSADTAAWTEDPSTGVNAQTYYIHIKYVGDDQHNDLVYDGVIEATIAPKSLKNTDINALALPSTMVYSGAPQGPAVMVRNTSLGAILTKDADYTIEYGTATNVGDYSLIVRGTGNYKDAVDVDYHITPYQVGADDKLVLNLGSSEFTYNGAVQRPSEIAVVLNGTRLVEGVDYDLAYLDENDSPVASVDAGAYEVKATLKGNYEGATAAGYTIKPKTIESGDVALTPATLAYNGSKQGPAVAVTSVLATSTARTQLVLGTDYLVTGNTATGAGTYTVTVSGKGNFTGSVEKQFTIAPQEVENLEVTFAAGMPADGFVYNGGDQRPSDVVVKVNETTLDSSAYTVTWPAQDQSVNAGTYSVSVALGGNYASTTPITLTYTIAPKPLTSDDVALNEKSFEYSGSSQGPEVTVTSVLVNGDQPKPLAATDYILSDATATDAGNYQVTVTGVGNYTGTVQKPYAIAKASVDAPGDANKPTAKQLVYNGEAQELVTPPATLPEGCAKIQYSTDNGATWSDDVPTGTNAQQYPIQIRYVGDKNHNDLDGGTITVTMASRAITLTGKSATKVFNGQEQRVAGVDDTGELKLVNGHTHNAEAVAKGTNVGVHDGTITAKADVAITDVQGEDVTANYDITTTPGKLTITKAPLADNGKGDGLLANEEGKPVAADGTITGDLTKQVPLVSVTGTGESAIYDGEDHVPMVKDAVTGEPLPASAYTVTYYNASDVENGAPVQNATSLTGDAATKNPGQKVALITCTESSNYQTGATIAVPMSLQMRPVTFVGESKSMVYDGQTHELTQTTVEGAGLVSGHTVSGLSYSATGIDKGTYPGTITDAAQVKIMASGTDVTSFYAITTTPGALAIGGQPVVDDGNGNAVEAGEDGTPKTDEHGQLIKRVAVVFDYDTAVYDGTEHDPSATDLLKNAPLVKDDDFTVEYYHAADIDEDGEPVEDATPLDATVAAADKVALVRFIKDYVGTVKVSTPVSKRAVTLAGVSDTRPYTGAEQSVAGVEDTGDLKLVSGHTHNATALAKGTEAGAHTGTITAAADVAISDAQGTDVTANYAVSTAAGTLTITPRAVNDGDPTSKINPAVGAQPGDDKPVVSVTGTNPGDTDKGHNTPGTSSIDTVPVYDDTEHGPIVTDAQGTPLTQGTDYEVAYYDPADIDPATGRPVEGATPLDPTDAGEKVAVVTFKGNYTGVVNVPVKVDPRPLRITSASATKPYDGTPLTAPDVLVWVAGADGVPAGCGLVDGQTIAVTVTGAQTNAGSSPNTYAVRFADTASAESAGGVRAEAATDAAYNGIAQDGNPTAKARNYAIQSEAADEGTLTVSPAKLTVTTPGATKAYDGKALTNSKGAKVDGLAKGETATVTCTGSQTRVGSSKNTYTLAWGTAQKENYTVAKENLGTLTVTAAATSIATGGNATGSVARSSLAKTADSTLTTLPACVAAAAIALIALALRKREHN